ncbi:UDP-galactopyranose mutase [Mitsuokella jalaludinii]|uniref:UDP-galactopyranose mutase n=2 Tax=Mitsuokella jalaludinii TaxID=187979 RepID=A0A173XKQ1_9FIRM|nr:UDP-galactopyranose mutase [Mitsuokella jalaludinii]
MCTFVDSITITSSASSSITVCASRQENIIFFGGRLAEYKYYDMDDLIKSALERVRVKLKK